MSRLHNKQILSQPEFWDRRYATADGIQPTHEWFRTFDTLEPFLEKYLFSERGIKGMDAKLLHLGSGDSAIPYKLFERGYINQRCVDFSTVVVDLMKSRHIEKVGVEWAVGDIRNMTEIDTQSVDVAFDKATLDSMIYGSPWSPPSKVLESCGKYVKEVLRVLKDDGVFLYVTYRQPHFINPILNGNNKWNVEVDVIGGGGSFQYFGFALRRKASALSCPP